MGMVWEMSTSPRLSEAGMNFGGIFANFGQPGVVFLSESGTVLRSGPVL